MSQPLALPSSGITLPAIVTEERAQLRFIEFFIAAIRSPNTRRAYARAAHEFLDRCHAMGGADLVAVGPLHVAT